MNSDSATITLTPSEQAMRTVLKEWSNWAKITKSTWRQVNQTNEQKPKRNKRIPIGNTLRFQIFMRDNFTCTYCGVNKEEAGVKLEVDHILPVSKGGTNKESNLTTACFSCNRGKRDKIVTPVKAKCEPQHPRDSSFKSTEIDLSNHLSIGTADLMASGTLTLEAGNPITTFDTAITTRASGR